MADQEDSTPTSSPKESNGTAAASEATSAETTQGYEESQQDQQAAQQHQQPDYSTQYPPEYLQQQQEYQQYQYADPSQYGLGSSGDMRHSSECNIYINALPKEINDEKLTQIFCTFGEIESARVMLDFNTRVSRGYGFVKFKTPDSARNAIQTMDGFQLGTNTLNVKLANESMLPKQTASNNIFMKGLPVTVKADQLRAACNKYGSVSDLRILEDFATGLSRGQALVRFDDVRAAEAAINELHGAPFPVAGNVVPLVAKFAENDDEKADRKTKMKKRMAAQRYLPYQHPAAMAMPAYGADGNVYQYYTTPEGYAYPYQANPYYPATGSPNSQSGAPQAAQAMAAASTHYDPSTGMPANDPNVYVYHLPPETSDVHIYQRFGKYGSVLSIKIARDPAGVCKGYGFIRFATMDSALRSIQGENGQRVGNKTLSVSLARQKGAVMG